MKLIETNLIKEYDTIERESEKEHIGRDENLIKESWTQTAYGKSNYQSEYEITNKYKIKYYDVLYHVKVYEYIYLCVCGKRERDEREVRKEIDRTLVGSSTKTDSHTTTRNY